MAFQKISLLLCLFVAQGSTTSCAKKSMNDRDVRREQLRINAHKKRQELEPLVGNYRGALTGATGFKQDVSLHLEIKDTPETEGGEVDPVLVPTVNGALSLTFGTGGGVELYSFGTTRADFNAADSRLDMIVANTQFKDISLSLSLAGNDLAGSWSSPSTSLSGSVELKREAELYLGGETPSLKGTYPGVLEWKDGAFYAKGALTFITAQDAVDSFHVSASLRIMLPGPHSAETFVYEYEAVEFNPLSRQVTIRSDAADIYFTGLVGVREVRGEWYSKRTGLIGPAVFSLDGAPAPAAVAESPAASGNWYGAVENIRTDSQLPERILLGFNGVPDAAAPGGLALVGSARFYYGPFTSTEYIEYRFETIDYQPFSRRLVAVTQGSPKLTIELDLGAAGTKGRITDSSLGPVATFAATRERTSGEGASIAGPYTGYFAYESIKGYQNAQITLVPNAGAGGLKFSAAVTLTFGPAGSGESLNYRFDEADFNAVTSLLTLSNPESDIVVKAHVAEGKLKGEWFSTALGRLGTLELTKANFPVAPAEYARLEKVKGTYRGSLRNTNPASNLPERILFGLITTVDPEAPRGLKVTGSARLYYGPFESTEYTELPFETLQFDPFRRTFVGTTSGALHLTVHGNLSNQTQMTGTLSDDSLGQVGEFEVEKHEP